jgi:hypothetical protein
MWVTHVNNAVQYRRLTKYRVVTEKLPRDSSNPTTAIQQNRDSANPKPTLVVWHAIRYLRNYQYAVLVPRDLMVGMLETTSSAVERTTTGTVGLDAVISMNT